MRVYRHRNNSNASSRSISGTWDQCSGDVFRFAPFQFCFLLLLFFFRRRLACFVYVLPPTPVLIVINDAITLCHVIVADYQRSLLASARFGCRITRRVFFIFLGVQRPPSVSVFLCVHQWPTPDSEPNRLSRLVVHTEPIFRSQLNELLFHNLHHVDLWLHLPRDRLDFQWENNNHQGPPNAAGSIQLLVSDRKTLLYLADKYVTSMPIDTFILLSQEANINSEVIEHKLSIIENSI